MKQEITGDPKIPEYMNQIDKSGLDWCDFLDNLPFTRPASYYINWDEMKSMYNESIDKMVPYHFTHIVNVTMGFKHPAMRALFQDDRDYAELAKRGIGEVIRKHGVASGCINGDEHLAGNDLVQGSELCAVVEYMFSLQSLIEVFGDTAYGDQMERLAYNALPATITEDFMGHQYLQQANQIMADDQERPWFNNNSDSTTFGLEPNFGCCTANMHQGWPKFVNSLWYREDESTLVSMVFAPNTVMTVLGGETVSVTLETQYPFRDQLVYRFGEVSSKRMKIRIRIPQWCKEPAMEVFISRWYRGSVAVERGPLVYGLDIKERWEEIKEVGGVKDYSVYPESPWNYAISGEIKPEIKEQEVSEVPFSKLHAPVRMEILGKQLDSWQMSHGNTGEMPVSPVNSENKEERISLIPFGCTKLRVSQFPYY